MQRSADDRRFIAENMIGYLDKLYEVKTIIQLRSMSCRIKPKFERWLEVHHGYSWLREIKFRYGAMSDLKLKEITESLLYDVQIRLELLN